MTNERRFRVFVLANLASLAGRQHITGIYRFLGEGHLWDLNLIRSFADYSPRILRAAIRDGYDGYIFVAPGDRDTNALYARLGAPVVFIARRAGYPDANYLKNLFRRKTGASMRDWRRQNGATSQHQPGLPYLPSAYKHKRLSP